MLLKVLLVIVGVIIAMEVVAWFRKWVREVYNREATVCPACQRFDMYERDERLGKFILHTCVACGYEEWKDEGKE